MLLERLEGQPRAVDDVMMSRRGGAPLPPDTLISTLADGECVWARPTVTQPKEEVLSSRGAWLAVATRTPMAGVAIECDLVNEKAPDIALTVLDELKQRHAFTYKGPPVRDVKRDLRDAEALTVASRRTWGRYSSRPRPVEAARRLRRLSEQGVVSGSALRHVAVALDEAQA